MSSAVIAHSRATGGAYTVLLMLATFTDDNGVNAWPSIKTLAEMSRISERTVQRHMRELIDLGEVDVAYKAGPQQTNRYRIVIPNGGDNLTSRQHDVVTNQNVVVTHVSPGVVTNRASGGDTGVTRSVIDPSGRSVIDPSGSTVAPLAENVDNSEPPSEEPAPPDDGPLAIWTRHFGEPTRKAKLELDRLDRICVGHLRPALLGQVIAYAAARVDRDRPPGAWLKYIDTTLQAHIRDGTIPDDATAPSKRNGHHAPPRSAYRAANDWTDEQMAAYFAARAEPEEPPPEPEPEPESYEAFLARRREHDRAVAVAAPPGRGRER